MTALAILKATLLDGPATFTIPEAKQYIAEVLAFQDTHYQDAWLGLVIPNYPPTDYKKAWFDPLCMSVVNNDTQSKRADALTDLFALHGAFATSAACSSNVHCAIALLYC